LTIKLKMMKKYALLTVSLLVMANYLMHAQNEVIPLWKTAIPGALPAENYKEENTYADGELQRTSQVTIPTLTVYQPLTVKANGSAVLICPGGGYRHLSMNKEGKKIAEWMNSLGITAFILKYRLPDDRIMKDKSIGPLQDAQEAIKMIRREAVKWKINPNKIGVAGFSAGGHLAATLSTHYDLKTYISNDTTSSRPDFSLLIYPVISMDESITHKGSRLHLLGNTISKEQSDKFSDERWTNSKTPPAFLVHATDDLVVPVENSIHYYLALKRSGVPAELHVYETGGHGFGLGREDNNPIWAVDCAKWLDVMIFEILKS